MVYIYVVILERRKTSNSRINTVVAHTRYRSPSFVWRIQKSRSINMHSGLFYYFKLDGSVHHFIKSDIFVFIIFIVIAENNVERLQTLIKHRNMRSVISISDSAQFVPTSFLAEMGILPLPVNYY